MGAMRKRRPHFVMVNGEMVDDTPEHLRGERPICECGSTCPAGNCFSSRFARSEPFEGHRGDEGEYDY